MFAEGAKTRNPLAQQDVPLAVSLAFALAFALMSALTHKRGFWGRIRLGLGVVGSWGNRSLRNDKASEN